MKFFNIFNTKDDSQLAPPTAGLAARIKAATKLTMDETSRQEKRAHLFEYTKMRPIRVGSGAPREHVSSNKRGALTFIRRHSMSAVTAVLIVMVSGGTVAAAETSLPGDILYPVKVHVTEEVRVALAPTPKARAAIAVERAERRLEEAATLALSGKLTDEVRAEIDANFERHVEDAEDSGTQLASSNAQEDASEVRANVGAMRVARENILARRIVHTAKLAAKAARNNEEAATMSMSAEPTFLAAQEATTVADDTETKGRRTAAKVRIDASRKFLDHSPIHLGTTTEVKARKQLKAATDAFFSGEVDAALGNKAEASSNFDSALEAATEIQTLISVSQDSKHDSADEDDSNNKNSNDDENRGSSGSDNVNLDL